MLLHHVVGDILSLGCINHILNTIEELIYIPCDKTYAVLAAEMDELLYLNREGQLYFETDSSVYRVDQEKNCPPLPCIDCHRSNSGYSAPSRVRPPDVLPIPLSYDYPRQA